MEQTAAALNLLCQDWLQRRDYRSRYAHIAYVNTYYQQRNAAAIRSRRGERFALT